MRVGAIAGRADRTLAERSQARDAGKDARANLGRLTKQREALPAFTPATDEDVKAARDAVVAAERASAAECGDGSNPKQRGGRCLTREAEEKGKRDALAAALTNKGLTDQAAKIDADTAIERRTLEKAPAVASVNPMAETLARIFHMQADDAATWQQVGTVIVVELLIAFALIAFELLGAGRKHPVVVGTSKSETVFEVGAMGLPAVPEALPAPAKPPIGDRASVGRFMLACLPRAEGERASWSDIYARYTRWCGEQQPQFAPLQLSDFGEQLGEICARVGIRTRSTRKAAYCVDVRLSA